MSRIGQILEQKALRQAVAQLQADVLTLQKLVQNCAQQHITADHRLTELEAKRGPGRPRESKT